MAFRRASFFSLRVLRSSPSMVRLVEGPVD
jgi:hypothetical protein